MTKVAYHVYSADGQTFIAGLVADRYDAPTLLDVLDTYGYDVEVRVMEVSDGSDESATGAH